MGKQINVDLAKCKNLKCEFCNSEVFNTKNIVKIIPKLLVGATEDIIQPCAVLECAKCGVLIPEHSKLLSAKTVD